MPTARFNGHDTLTYADYVDASTGRTLVAVPGQSYTTAVAPGRNAGLPAIPGDGRWSSSGTADPLVPLGQRLTELTLAGPGLPELPPLPAAGDPEPTPAAADGESASPESEG